MKTLTKYLLLPLTLMILSGGALLANDNEGNTVGINAIDMMVPSNFDSTNDPFVVISGYLPNGCYRWRGADVKHIGPMMHEIRAEAKVFPGYCITVLQPYTKEVHLGKLDKGEHKVTFVNADGTQMLKTMRIN